MNALQHLFGQPAGGALAGGLGLAFFLAQPALTECQGAGTVIAWGANDSLQSVVPTGLSNVVAVAGGTSHSLALRANGTVVAWGFNLSGQTNVPPGLTNAAAIAGGAAYSLALSNGVVIQWGNLPAAPADLTNAIAIAGGSYHALAIRSNGTVVAWGSQTSVPADLTNAVSVAAGNGQSVALRADGSVVAWGDNAYGKTNVPTGLANVKAIAAGGDHCLALKRDGSIVGWGRNDYSQATAPTGLGTVIGIGAGALHSVALRADGTLAAWGDNTFNQTVVSQVVPGFIAVAAGGYHGLAIKGDNFPFILLQPISQNVFITKTGTLQVTAAGAAPLTYQWRRYGTNLPGATNATLVLGNFQPNDAGPYEAQVANSYGTALSQTAVLSAIGGPPALLAPLVNQTVICGDSAAFQVSVDGSGPFGYQWQFNGTPIAGATGSSISLPNVTLAQGGAYSVSVTNAFSSISTGAVLTVTVQPPSITSTLAAAGKQGQFFTYSMTALHHPLSFGATYLPQGLTVNTNTGLISGTPQENGTFGVILRSFNACSYDAQTLVLTIASSVPVITSASTATGTEGSPLTYQITATQSPTSFGAQNLPVGVLVNPSSGALSGTPVYSGTVVSTLYATNQWGVGAATLRFTIANAAVNDLGLDNIGYSYHSPYLLDFQFTLRDNSNPNQGNGIVTQPNLVSAICREDWPVGTFAVSWPPDFPKLPTATTLQTNYVAETGIFIARGSGKVMKTYLVLDYSDSISDPLINGDSNGDGISDAVDNMVTGAEYFVDQQPGGVQVGVFEFHRDDEAPQQVIGLSHNKPLVDAAIAGIWTNDINSFYAGSRCWDAVEAAIQALGAANPDEQHYIVFVSDGLDYSSSVTVNQLITDAKAASIQIYCIAFGNNPDLATLRQITTQTKGHLYQALTPANLYQQFALVSKDLQAQYVLRWATLRRDPALTFLPFFLISYQGQTNTPPPWVWDFMTNIDQTIDTNSTPPVTNSITNITVVWSNPVLGPYSNAAYAGPVTNGFLRLVADDVVQPSGITLRATYIPRWVRQIRLHYQPNWPCTPILNATNAGEMLSGWLLTQTNDVDGSEWLLLSSPNPANQATSLPFAGFGPLVTFQFRDILNNISNAFNFITIDNSIYTAIVAGGQTFAFESGSPTFVTAYPPLPHGTPIPWLMQYGYSGNFTNAETADKDNDGAPNWQEYRANTDPTNAASKFVIRSVVRGADGRFQITFSTSANRTYRVDCSTDLVNWQVVQDNIPAVNGDVAITDTRYLPGAYTFFYRVAVY